ncbi:cell division protein ZapA [bacterium]|nr:MAG: cell division protein ZapA [bacterium]RKZ16882.1 MAG: cell division protein ZapA [bacterium]
MEQKSTTVRIHGQDYTIRADRDDEYVKTIARYVDDRMQDIARDAGQVTSLRVAILSALNIADELFQERESGRPDAVHSLEERARRLVATLEEVVDESSSESSSKSSH